MVKLPEYSTCGKINLVVLAVILLVLSPIAAFTTWWQLWFENCNPDSDAYYFLHLNQGLCISDSKGDGQDISDCTSWSDIEDNAVGDASDGAVDFIAASHLVESCIAFSALLCIISVGNFFVPKQFAFIVRIALVAVALLSCLLMIVAFAVTNNNYFYHTDNYGTSSFCDSTTIPSGGYASGILLLFFFFGFAASALYPCCCYATASSGEESPLTSIQA